MIFFFFFYFIPEISEIKVIFSHQNFQIRFCLTFDSIKPYKTLSPETLKREIIPQLELVGLILQEPDPDDKRRLLIYPTVSTPIISAKLRESEGKCSKNYERNRAEHYGVAPTPTPSPSPTTAKPPASEQ